MTYDLLEAQSFWDCVDSLRRDDDHKAALVDSLSELRRRPFQNSKLKTHGVGNSSNGKKLYASDVGGRRSDRRLVWQLFNKTIVILLYGTHKIYDRAKRMSIEFDPATQQHTVYERAPDSGTKQLYARQRERIGKLFMAWTDQELVSRGLPNSVITHLRLINSDDEFLAMEDNLGPYFETAFDLIAGVHQLDQWAGDPQYPGPVEAEEPPSTKEDREVERHLANDQNRIWFTRIEPEFLADVIGKPIEDWMIFLHPDQRVAIQRHYTGPARVRGSAGTGKTVVGLHRAVWLAKQNLTLRQAQKSQLMPTNGVIRPVLFTTFIKTLPPVFESLYMRIPAALAGEVHFLNVDHLAHKICKMSGERVHVNMQQVNEAFATAFDRVVAPGTPLARSGFTKRYIREEIQVVIKGRAIDSINEYFRIARTGRRVPMSQTLRSQVWELREAWDEEMARRGVIDFPDVIVKALHYARQLSEPHYSAVIVDEAQDITMAGLLFLRALVNAPHPDRDRPNGMLILGDGAQRIYPGGYTLRQAGIEVRGRTTVLAVNYRNTDEILNAAMAVAGDSQVQDIGEIFRRGDEPLDASRKGPRPLLVKASGINRQLDEIIDRIHEITKTDKDIGNGDIAVLVPMNHLVNKVRTGISQAGLGIQRLESYDGKPNNLIKVGTFHRGKGLEFKVVFLPYLTRGYFPRRPKPNQSVEEAAEARELEISQLFVAMTRARDILILLYNDFPSEAIVYVVDHFNQQEQLKGPQQN